MAEDTKDLVGRIQGLTREETMEAALALGAELGGDAEPPSEARGFLDQVEQAPLRHIDEGEELARVLLIAAAGDEEYAPTVRRIWDEVGQKVFILGGLEIVALVGLAVTALHIVVSKGRTSQSKTTTYEFDSEGKCEDRGG